LKMGLIGSPEKSIRNYHSTLYNISEERIAHKNRGGSPKPGIGVLPLAQIRVGAGQMIELYYFCGLR